MFRIKATHFASSRAPIRRWLFFKSRDTVLSDPVKITPSNALIITQQEPQDVMHMIATLSPTDLNEVLGKGVVRATRVEAAVRMMADMLMFYDDLDVNYLDKELELEFGEGHAGIKNLEEEQEQEQQQEGSAVEKSPHYSSNSSRKSALNHNHQKYGEEILAFLSDKASTQAENTSRSADSSSEDNLEDTLFGRLSKKPTGTHRSSTWPTKESLENYVELQAGSNAVRYAAKNSNGASRSLINYMGTYRPDLLKGVSQRLLTADGLPNIKTFHYLIRQLTLYQYTKPAQLALECLYLSDMPLSIQTWSIGINVAIANGSISDFLRLARLLNLKQIADDSLSLSAAGKLEPISSYPAKAWLTSQPGDEKFGRRFFGSMSENSNEDLAQQLAQHLAGTVGGFSRFGLYSHIDTIMRFFKVNNLELNIPLLTILMRCAYHTADNVRAQWTWSAIKQLVSDKGLQVLDHTALDTAKNTFSRLEDEEMLAQVDHYASQLGNTQQRLYRKTPTPLNRLDSP